MLLIEHHFEFPSLKGDCTGSSESTLVKMPHCWKSHFATQISNPHGIQYELLFKGPGVPVYLAPWTACPLEGKSTAVGFPPPTPTPPGGKLSRDILPSTLVIFTPGGQAVQAGLSCPRPTQVKIYICYFVIFLYHFNEFRSSISHKVRNWCLWG